jgi:Na+-transporting methylmalonyl-CoA/oxaloacetate decarboxylase gamma subunit
MLMLVGMGTVFAFLTVLVIAMTLLASLAGRLQPASAQPLPGDAAAEVAAVAAAVEHHRRSTRS